MIRILIWSVKLFIKDLFWQHSYHLCFHRYVSQKYHLSHIQQQKSSLQTITTKWKFNRHISWKQLEVIMLHTDKRIWRKNPHLQRICAKYCYPFPFAFFWLQSVQKSSKFLKLKGKYNVHIWWHFNWIYRQEPWVFSCMKKKNAKNKQTLATTK